MREVRVVMLALATAVCSSSGAVHVSATGDDMGTGSAQSPVRTLARARDLARASAHPAEVVVHAGCYRLDGTLSLTAADSRTRWTADGEVRVTGARRVDGWTVGTDGVWSAAVPWVGKDRAHGFRSLFVNDQPRPRARLPKKGFFTILNDDLPEGASYDQKRPCFFYDPAQFKADWSGLSEAEIVCFHFWTDSHLRIASVDGVSNKVTFVSSAGKAFDTGWTNNKSGGERGIYVIENLPAALTDPGEWRLDYSARRVYYKPMPGETPESVVVEVPFVETLVAIDGAEDVAFCGIRFERSQYELPATDVNNAQASTRVAAAVRVERARNCRFEDCAFADLAGYGIRFGLGTASNAVARCRLFRLGAGGVILDGGKAGCATGDKCTGNEISDCRVGPYGRDFRSGVGILVKHADGTRVTHNEIFDGYYTGVSVGWVWGYGPSASVNNEISHNHIHDIGQGLLSDMGGIYTLGVSHGTKIVRNRIHDVDARAYGGWGIYNDEGSTGILIEGNVVYDTKFAGYDVHYAKDLTVRNNIFAFGRKEQLARTRAEKHRTVTFVNNIVCWTDGVLFSGNWDDKPLDGGVRNFVSDENLYFNPAADASSVKFYGDMDMAAWQAAGRDGKSSYADPQFADASRRDFRLNRGSPAFALGFRDFDQADVGPRDLRSR